MKHADELLNSIWKQRRQRYIEQYNPKLEVMIHEEDLKTILVEKMGISMYAVFGPPSEWREHIRPRKIFGEDLIITDEAVIGEPLVIIK